MSIITSASFSVLAIAQPVTCPYLYGLFLSAGIQAISNIKGSMFFLSFGCYWVFWTVPTLTIKGWGINNLKVTQVTEIDKATNGIVSMHELRPDIYPEEAA